MAIVSGPELDKIAKEAKEWYLEMREYLIKALEGDDYPFGSVRLSLTEQVAKYDSMTPMDWSTMIENLYKRYKGRQGALKLVGDDIARYRGRMERLKARMGLGSEVSTSTVDFAGATTTPGSEGYNG